MATTFINGAAIDDTGRMLVTSTTPTATWPFLGGFAYDPVTMALAIIDAVPTAIDPYVNGLRVTPLGQVYVTIIPPTPPFYIGGLPRDGIGRLFFSSDPPIGTAPGGWPITGSGGIAGSGLVALATVITDPATNVANFTATLNGTVSSNGASTTTSFQYGLSTSYGSSITAVPSPLAANAVSVPVSANVAGLDGGTLYHFRAVGTNSVGTAYGADLTFTTLGVQPGNFFAPETHSLIPTYAGGDPTPTFTRPTTAYASNNEGVLRLSASNESRFVGARRIENLVLYSSEDFATWWSKTGCTLTYGVLGPTGLNNANTLTATGASGGNVAGGMQTPPTGAAIVSSIWVRRRTGTGTITLEDVNVGQIDITSQVTSTWRRFATAPTVPLSPAFKWFGMKLAVMGDAIDLAYHQVENVTGQSNQAPGDYVSIDVVTHSVPYHGAGVDGVKYFPTTNGNSVLVNLLLQSQALDTTLNWNTSGSSITPNATSAPDSTLTADALVDTTGNQTHSVFQNVILPVGTTYTVSVYAKAAGQPWLQLSFVLLNTSVWVNFNLVTGAIGFKSTTVAPGSPTAQSLPNGWWRLSFTITNDNDATTPITFTAIDADKNSLGPVYTGPGTIATYLWGAQLGRGTPVAPYIATTTAPTDNVVVEAPGLPLSETTTNLCLQSQTFERWYTDPGGLAVTPNAIAAPDGTMTADMMTELPVSNPHRLYQFIPCGNEFITVSCYFKAGTGTWVQLHYYDGTYNWANINVTTGVIGNYGSNEGSLTPTITAVGNGWFRCSITLVGHAPGSNLSLYMMPSDVPTPHYTYLGTGKTVYYWGAQFERSPNLSPYVATGGAPSHAMLGCVSEDAATNLLINSETFTAWAKDNSTIAINNAVAPNGAMTAALYTDNATSAPHRIYAGMAIASGKYTFSMYAKKGTLTWVMIYGDDSLTGYWGYINIGTGEIGNVSAGAVVRAQALPNGWFRCSITFTSAGTNGLCVFNSALANGGATPSYVGTGQTMYVWGGQCETGDYPTSYVPTAAAVVTRNFDALDYVENGNFPPATGTGYMESYFPYATPGKFHVQTRMLPSQTSPMSISPGQNANVSGTSGAQYASTPNTIIAGVLNKSAAGWGPTSGSVCLDGDVVGTVATMDIPYPTNQILRLGGLDTDGYGMKGTIRNVKFQPTRVTDAELVTMTAIPPPPPTFYLPLVNTFNALIYGGAFVPVFTRATTAYVTGISTGDTSSVSGVGITLCAANEARFWGPRHAAVNQWLPYYLDGIEWINPSGFRGFFAENAAQNLLLQSTALATSPWNGVNVGVALNQAASPDRSASAAFLGDNAVNAAHHIYQIVAGLFSGAYYTFSVYLKAGSRVWSQVALGLGSTTHWANINLQTGATGFTSGIPLYTQVLGNGWRRVWMVAQLTGTTGHVAISVLETDANMYVPPYLGNGSGYYYWGPQMEGSLSASSYIPTTTAVVTRSADTMTYALPGNVNGATGASYAEFTMPPISALNNSIMLRETVVGGFPMYFEASTRKLGLFTPTSGTITTANTILPGVLTKGATTWNGALASVCLSGGAVAGGAYTSFTTTTGSLQVGSAGDLTALDGTIRNVKIYNVKLANVQLQGLTT